jgi:hypothetical protein
MVIVMAVTWFKPLVTGLRPWMSGFNSMSIHVGFVIDEVELGQALPEDFGFTLSVPFH